MPAKSERQRRFLAMALALKEGKLKTKKVRNLKKLRQASKMSKKQLKEYIKK